MAGSIGSGRNPERRNLERTAGWVLGDVVLAGLFVWITVVSLRSDAFTAQYGAIEGAGWILALSPTVLLPVRRFAPASALATVTVLYFAISTTQGDSNAPLAAPFFTYAVGLALPIRASGAMTAASAAVLAVATLVGPGDPDPLTAIVWFLLFGGGWLVALSIRQNRSRAQRLTDEVSHLEAQKANIARTAVTEERARIARELHDAVGHAVNVMVLQAGAAGLTRDPDTALATLSEIERVGRSALIDLDHLLGLLHDTDDPTRTPSHSLDDIARLVDELRTAGADIGFENQCHCPVDWRTGAAAYRIAQESLTNAIKYAGQARIDITMTCNPGEFDWSSPTTAWVLVRQDQNSAGAAFPEWQSEPRCSADTSPWRHAPMAASSSKPPSQGAGHATRHDGPGTTIGVHMTITVLIVDDDTLVRAGLRMMIETQDDLIVVAEAATGEHGIQLARELEPDVVLMDIRMPGTDGIEATRQITGNRTVNDRPERPSSSSSPLSNSTTTCTRPSEQEPAASSSNERHPKSCSTGSAPSPTATAFFHHPSPGDS